MASGSALCSALFDALHSSDPKMVAELGTELEAYRAAFLQRSRLSPLLRDMLRAIEEAATLAADQRGDATSASPEAL